MVTKSSDPGQASEALPLESMIRLPGKRTGEMGGTGVASVEDSVVVFHAEPGAGGSET